MKEGKVFCFHHGWHFLLADEFPMQKDTDLFRDRIKDAGSGQKRTAAFYRNYLTVPKEYCGQKVLIEFE